MIKEKKLIIAIWCFAVSAALVLLFLIIDYGRTNYGADEPVSQREYAVYSELLNRVFVQNNVKVMVVKDATSVKEIAYLGETLKYVQRELPVSGTTLKNFEVRNRHSRPIEPMLNCRNKYVLISPEQIEDVFRDEEGWQTFNSRYPHSSGLLTLSRVGFGGSLNEAVVYLSQTTGGLSGSGVFYLLRNQEGRWRLFDELQVWVS